MPPAPPGIRVLVVEDDAATREVLREALQLLKYDVLEAASARVARDARGFEIALLDLHLPDGDGLTVLKHWRESGVDAPVLILTAERAAEAIDRALVSLDAWDYLAKPFELEALERLLADTLRRSRERGSIERRLAG
jgi:two-component system response regulator BasR